MNYLTIRLFALDFYEVIVGDPKLCALERSLGLNGHYKLKLCVRASFFSIVSRFIKSRTVNVLFVVF